MTHMQCIGLHTQKMGNGSLFLAESNGSLPTTGFMTHVNSRLTAKNWGQLLNPTLGNRVWATFTFYILWFAIPKRHILAWNRVVRCISCPSRCGRLGRGKKKNQESSRVNKNDV